MEIRKIVTILEETHQEMGQEIQSSHPEGGRFGRD